MRPLMKPKVYKNQDRWIVHYEFWGLVSQAICQDRVPFRAWQSAMKYAVGRAEQR